MTTVAEVKIATEGKMKKAVEKVQSDLAKIRTGRAHAGVLDNVMVDYYGAATAITQVASVSLSDARTIMVSPWEKNLIPAIEKAIRESGLGLNPASDSGVVRVPMPVLNEERRKELVKVIKTEAEQGRIAIRNIRRDANQTLKDAVKAKTMPEDDEKKGESEIQKLTDAHIAHIEKLLLEKEKELMTV